MYPAGATAKLRVQAVGNGVGNTANGVQKVEIFVDGGTTPVAAARVGTTDVYEATYAIPADAVAGSSITLTAIATNVAGLSDDTTTGVTIVSGMKITADTIALWGVSAALILAFD